jgi:hypothetical protein
MDGLLRVWYVLRESGFSVDCAFSVINNILDIEFDHIMHRDQDVTRL